MSDFVLIFYWYLILLAFGFGFLPLNFLIFPKLKDKAYGLSKTFAILLVAYVAWFLSSLRILNFQWLGVWVLMLSILPWLFAIYKLPRLKKEINVSFNKLWPLWLGQELLFLLALIFWALIRSYQPNIEGLEKFMDLGIVNTVLRSEYMPPKDMWLTGFKVNYYYFGHFISAFLTKISSLPSQYTYNLMMATIFSLSVSAAFSFVFNFCSVIFKKALKLSVLAGLMAAFLLNLGGNFHSAVYAFRKGINYWYPDATRYIGYNPDVADKTIHEFPIYSYVVADLHGHMINIPHVILGLTLIFYFIHFVLKNKNNATKATYAILLGLVFSVSYMTNSWDLPIYFGVFGVSLLVGTFLAYKKSQERAFHILFFPLLIVLSWFIFTLPYNLNFVNFAKGIEITWTKSLFYQLVVLWGFGWFFGFSYAIYQLFRFYRTKKPKLKAAFNFPTLYPIILSVFSLVLVIIPEYFYLKDIYIKSHYRANTMFKLGYQAFVLSSLVAAITLAYFIYHKAKAKNLLLVIGRLFWLVVAAGLFSAVAIYPYFAIKGYYGTLKNRHTLNGWKYLAENHPGDLAAINWLNQNTTGQPVILEAVGDSYTTYARISANTGLPTVLGWPVHEWLWRGSYDIPGTRTGEVQQAYEGTDFVKLKQFIQKYDIKYIVLGKLEKEKYQNLNEDIFKEVGQEVFTEDGTTIYQLP